MSFIILDVQGFQIEDGKTFVVKELAAYDGKKLNHCVFKPPFQYSFLSLPERRNVIWVEENYHGIRWQSGYTDLEHLSKIINEICTNYDIVYVKGKEKAILINSYLKDKSVVEIPQDEEPSLSRFPGKPKCFAHFRTYSHCALSNVFLLFSFLEI